MSIRERRRARREAGEDAALASPADGIAPEVREQTQVTAPMALVEKKKDLPMNGPKAAPIILNERDDNAIDKLLDESGTYGPTYIVSVDVSRKAGNTTPRFRTGIQCPLLQLKTLGVAITELVGGGGQYKIDVYYDDRGNRKKFMPSWWEAFTDPPKIGQPYESLTLFWDETGGDQNQGAWTTVARGGTARAAEAAAPIGGGGFGPLAASGQVPMWQRPMRGPDGAVFAPPPNLQALLPTSLRNYGPEAQWQILAADYERRTGRKAELEPIDIAMQWKEETRGQLGEIRVDKTRLEERYESHKEASKREVDAANRRVNELEKKLAEVATNAERALEKAEVRAREERRDLETKQLNEKIAELATRRNEPKAGGSSGGMFENPALITAMAGIATAMITANQQAADRQMNMMMTLMKPAAPPPPPPSLLEQVTPLIVALAPVLAPAITSFLASRDPDKIDSLETERQQRQLQLYSMLMDNIRSLSPAEEQPPIWYAPVMALINGAMGSLQNAAIAAGAQRLPALPNGQPVQQQAPVQQQTQQRVVEAVVSQPARREEPAPIEAEQANADLDQQIEAQPSNLEQQIDEMAKFDPAAANVTRLVMRAISAQGMDPRLLTPEWTAIIFDIHHRPSLDEAGQEERIDKLVENIVDHLEHCRRFSLLPTPLASVFEKPEELENLLKIAPAFMADPQYGADLFEACVEEIHGRERERLAALNGENDIESDDDGDDEEDDEDDGDGNVAAGGTRS